MHRAIWALLALGCGSEPSSAVAPPVAPQAPAPVAKADPCAKAIAHGPLRWFEDDYAGALACARHKRVPMVVDLWAPWCHTCLSMKSTVLVDRSLADQADRFVFLALDTDREVNAAAVDKLPPSAWPTFYVIGTDENVLGRFVGGASLSQFRELLAAGARASDKRSTGADAKLLEAERAIAAKQPAEAQAALTEALAQAPAEWTRRPDALVSLVGVLAKRGDAAGCLALGEKSMDQTGNTASATDFAALTLACTAKLDGEAGRIKQLRERVVVRLTKLVDDAASPLSIDDRSDALLNLRDALVALGRSDDAKQTAERQRALLDDAAAKASDARAAMTFNWPRAEVYVFLGRPLDLVPALEKSIRDLPGEYDPPARLGWLLFKAGKLDDAARMTDAALRLAYGPRKVRVLTLRADIAAAAKDANAERTYRSQIVAALEALPASQTTPEQIAKAKEALRQLTQ